MPTLNEAKYATLLALTGESTPITLNELEMVWLYGEGFTTGTRNERWLAYFAAEGFAEGSVNQRAYNYLFSLGFFGTLNERWYQFWVGGGAGGISLISDTDAVAALWTERGTNTVVDATDDVEITNVDDDGGCYLRLSTTTILSEALVDGTNYRIVFRSKTTGVFYLGLTADTANKVMTAGLNAVNFKPLGSVDLTASFLNISLPEGVGQVEAIGHSIRVWKIT